MLIKMTWGHGIPAIKLCDDPQMDKPVHLDRFMKGPGGVFRDVMADPGDFLELRFAFLLRRFSCHFLSQLSMAPGKKYGGITGDIHGLQLFESICGQGIIGVVKALDTVRDPGLEINQAHAINASIQRRVTRSALLHEFSKKPCFIGRLPVSRDM